MASMATCFTLPPIPRHLLVFKAALLPNRSQTSNFPGAASRFPQSRASASAVRASIAAIRPGGAVESDKLPSDVRKRAMDAVDACGRRVTVGDVAGRAGLKLHEAQNALQALASDTQGFLEVSDEGDVLYVFPRDYRAKLVGRSFIMRVEPQLEMAKAGAEYLARVSFGTTLIASIILVFAAILVALIAIALKKQKEKPQPVAGTLKFGESFFSFVFGDGDPNRGIEEKRWKLIGNYISSNGGVVAAEELAPYLDIETTGDTLVSVVMMAVIKFPIVHVKKFCSCTDEAYILPVLSRYEGQPLIDEEGNILYQFPSLQRTASRKMRICPEIVGEADKFLKEEKWQFSKISIAKRAMVVGLGGLNVFGVLILRGLLQDPIVAQVGFIKFITSINPLLQIYAGFFFVIPLFRGFVLLKTNADIEKRNQARQQFAQDIELPDLSLRRKLLSARNMAQRIVIGLDRIVYSSSKDLFEQELDRGFQQIDKS
ncbi:hypothetical protein RchiOBHm_Chr3g0473761 [Rosa chinensis]|uniref:Iron-sulfur cluster biosynthesis family protein n=1 Tax=Rosa chinensis TaxID=74649 RepID=A0A2P6RBY2_ROSCH|nr:hypothetical protein RchiOBHm_Chr3g0473761 [Rosa chinensis]